MLHQILSLARLPIPPRPQTSIIPPVPRHSATRGRLACSLFIPCTDEILFVYMLRYFPFRGVARHLRIFVRDVPCAFRKEKSLRMPVVIASVSGECKKDLRLGGRLLFVCFVRSLPGGVLWGRRGAVVPLWFCLF